MLYHDDDDQKTVFWGILNPTVSITARYDMRRNTILQDEFVELK